MEESNSNSNSNSSSDDNNNNNKDEQEPGATAAEVVIIGGGIVGLVLALALKKHCGICATIYERAAAFHDDVGAGMGMYPNGLRVIRDISPSLLAEIRQQGHAYVYRRWERHDGSELMSAEETVLCRGEHADLSSIGIRRWRLQKVLYDAAMKEGIVVHFKKRTLQVQDNVKNGSSTSSTTTTTTDDGLVRVDFDDGTHCLTHVLFGADGSKSTVRQVMAGKNYRLDYTGVTCLMGMATDCPKSEKGISFPSSTTTKCHAVFFPTDKEEQCFQFHFPIAEQDANPGNWGTLSETVGREECRKLAERLRKDGWHERYLSPLDRVTNAVRIGFCLLQPRLDKWVYGRQGRIVLVGDAAHPPVPYIGQGAQMGIEDAGTIALLLQNMCLDHDNNNTFSLNNFSTAMKIYEKLRIPRTSDILDLGMSLGKMQQKRADNAKYDAVQEELIQREVFYHETLPAMIPGSTYDYKTAAKRILEEHPERLPVLHEHHEEDDNTV